MRTTTILVATSFVVLTGCRSAPHATPLEPHAAPVDETPATTERAGLTDARTICEEATARLLPPETRRSIYPNPSLRTRQMGPPGGWPADLTVFETHEGVEIATVFVGGFGSGTSYASLMHWCGDDYDAPPAHIPGAEWCVRGFLRLDVTDAQNVEVYHRPKPQSADQQQRVGTIVMDSTAPCCVTFVQTPTQRQRLEPLLSEDHRPDLHSLRHAER